MICANGRAVKGSIVRCLNGRDKTYKVANIDEWVQPVAVLDNGRRIPETSMSVAWAVVGKPYGSVIRRKEYKRRYIMRRFDKARKGDLICPSCGYPMQDSISGFCPKCEADAL